MYYVYVLYSPSLKRLYKGLCKDLKSRISQHKAGQVKSTSIENDWHLIYYQAFVDKTDARREELFLKSGKGRQRLRYLLKNTLKN